MRSWRAGLALVAAMLVALVAAGPATAESAVDPDAPRIVYRISGGEPVDTGEVCETSEGAIRCYQDDVQTLLSNDMGWVVEPVPPGDLLDATPSGWWVVHGDTVIPADDVAASLKPAPQTLDDLLVAVSTGDAVSRAPFGVPWAVLILVIVAALVVPGTWWLRRRKR